MQTTSTGTEINDELVHNSVSRILCVSWVEQSENAIFLPETAAVLNERQKEGIPTDIQVCF